MGPNNWLTAIHRATSTWGGVASTAFFPLDAWEPGGLWDRLVQRFDPDVVWLGVDGHPSLDLMRRRYAPLTILGDRMLVHREDSLQGDGTVPLAPVAAAPSPNTATPYVSYRLDDSPDCLKIMLAGACGYLNEATLKEIRETSPTGCSAIALSRSIRPNLAIGLATDPRIQSGCMTRRHKLGKGTPGPPRHPRSTIRASVEATRPDWEATRGYQNQLNVHSRPSLLGDVLREA